MQRRHFICLALLPFALAAAQASAAYPEYRVTIVGPANSVATGINSSGTVVGNYTVGSPSGRTGTGGFVNRGNGLVDLGVLGSFTAGVVAINDKGEVLGNRAVSRAQQRGFIYYRGAFRTLASNPSIPLTYTDINNAGYTVAIGAPEPDGAGQHSYLRAPNGRLRDLGALPGENPETLAEALNNRNQVAGESGYYSAIDPSTRPFRWTNGVMRDLGDFGYMPNYAFDINDRGQVTGFAGLATAIHDRAAFIYSKGRLIDIDGRPSNTYRASEGHGINNLGHVVGTSDDLSGFIYRGRRRESLNALIDPDLGWNVYYPRAINDKGQIAATAVRGGVSYAVRLDRIRPSLEAAPPSEADDEAGPILGQATPDEPAQADTQAHEVVQPVQQ